MVFLLFKLYMTRPDAEEVDDSDGDDDDDDDDNGSGSGDGDCCSEY